MPKEILLIGVAVGYMLKVLKSQKIISKFHKEFAAIRHGNYFDFINLIKEPIPEMVVYKNGQIEVNPILKKEDFDFELLLKAGPSLKKFITKCRREFGDFNDDEVHNKIYYDVALFEIGLRMHANNSKLLKEREKFVDVIDKLCSYKSISKEEVELLHKGRKFLNMIKHFNYQFKTWKDGIDAFNVANNIVKKHNLTVK